MTLNGATAFRHYSVSTLQTMIENRVFSSSWYVSKLSETQEHSLKIIDSLIQYDKTDYSIRVESDILDIYTNNKDLYDVLSNNLSDILRYRCEPSPLSATDLEDANVILTKKLPQDKYQFRMYLKPHKMAGDIDGKRRYLNWLKLQMPRVTCTESIESWFLRTDWNWDRRYILVEDDATLMLLQMRDPEVCGRVYKFVLHDK
ncbi:MAG: hypothetical protein ABFD07_17690 [Methanobacterium sp.]